MENIRLDSERESPRDHPSVNRHGCTDDVGGLVRANEDAGVGILFGSARAAVGPAIKLASAPRRAAAKRIEFLLSTFLLLTTGELIALPPLIQTHADRARPGSPLSRSGYPRSDHARSRSLFRQG